MKPSAMSSDTPAATPDALRREALAWLRRLSLGPFEHPAMVTLEQVEQALTGGLTEWMQRPEGWLALVLLLDQLPRMIFRDTPKAFSGDLRAQKLVAQGIAADFDRQLAPIQRVFILLVFEHSENLAVQNEGVSRHIDLVAQQPESDRALFADYLDFAERHQKVIAQFGRFPHRNAVLGRESTAEELAFLSKPGSRF